MTIEVLFGIVITLGFINLAVVLVMLNKIYGISKELKEVIPQLKQNKSNINKIIEILDVLIKKNKGKDKINLN